MTVLVTTWSRCPDHPDLAARPFGEPCPDCAGLAGGAGHLESTEPQEIRPPRSTGVPSAGRVR